MCLVLELVSLKHPGVVQGEGELGVFGHMGLGLHLSLSSIQGELMLQDQMKPPKECAK